MARLSTIARVKLPATKAGMRLMSKAGWWIHHDGRVSKQDHVKHPKHRKSKQ